MGEAAEKLTSEELTSGAATRATLAAMDRLPSLYYLTAEVAAILDAEGLTEEEAKTDLERLDGLLPQIERKVSALAHFVQLNQDLASTLKLREQAIAATRKAAEAKAERWLEYLRDCLAQAEIQRITDPKTGTTVALQNNPPSADPTDLDAIPRRFWIMPEPQPLQLDKRALLEALKAAEKAGTEIPGARLKRTQRAVLK